MQKFMVIGLTLVAGYLLTLNAAVAQKAHVSQSTWQVGCGDVASGKKVCQIQRDIKHNNGKDLVARLFVTRDADKKTAVMRFLMPLAVNLPYGVRFAITKGEKRGKGAVIGYQHCMTDGCLAVVPFTPELAKALRDGKTLHIGFASKTLNGVEISVDLKGFTFVHKKFLEGV
ncbi:MAG: invasion associated locus B family protein [Hyphomicrobiales bacterium]